ncbi:MAG: leucine-rich repeat protein [Acholeplasmataceae bacterium]
MYRCPNFNAIIIPSNVTIIGEDAFYNCSKI